MKTTVAIVGLGSRGRVTYAPIAKQYPDLMEITALADINPACVEEAAKEYNVPKERCFTSAEELLAQPKLADAIFICTQDQDHVREALMALEKGYHILMEKPISPSAEDCNKLLEASRKYDRKIVVCHVLRYTPFYRRLKAVLDEGTIGEVVSVQAIEKVCYWHQAHSFVRGNWSRSEDSCPMILAKCCHDTDILTWLAGSSCAAVSSFGSLAHFNAAHKPDGATEYCLDGCMHRDRCPYYAPRFYLEHPKAVSDGFVSVVSLDPSREAVLNALQRGPYGRCVYQCDNDVVDNQVVNLLYENGVSVSMTMCAFTEHCERIINVMGSCGQIRGNMESSTLEISDFASGNHTTLHVHTPAGGHSGSDAAMMRDFLQTLHRGGGSKTSADASVESHLIALAAEESRLRGGEAIDMNEWRTNE